MFVRLRRLIVLLALADFIGAQLALWAADLVRRWLPFGSALGDNTGTFLNPILHLIVAVVFPITFLTLSVYDVKRDTRPVGDPMRLTGAVAVGVFIFAGMLYFSYRDIP